MRTNTWRVALVSTLTAMLALSACSTPDDSADDGATSTDRPSLGSDVPTTPPTEIAISQPLSATPDAKSVTFLQCPFPACARFWPGISAGADELGWTAKKIVFDAVDPGAAMSQAIRSGTDYIAITGVPTAAIEGQLAEAKAAGIPVLSCGTLDKPSADGYAVQCGGSLEPDAELMGKWIAADSGGDAKVVNVTISAYTSLASITDWFDSTFASVCDGCTTDTLEVSIEDAGAGKIPERVVSYLQTHPDTNYVNFTLGDFSVGVGEVLKSSGVGDDVKLVGEVANPDTVTGVGDGSFAAVTLSPNEYAGAVMIDAAARLAVDGELSPDYQETVYLNPVWVLDSPEEADRLAETDNNWPGPQDYMAQFASLWNS